ncbi:MAG: D-alanine--D-alanine ligase [Nitrospira sp.]|nr:D-alanine--D-alanine ligase [Nitrospira sp.]
MKKRLQVLVLFDLRTPPPPDLDFSEELKTEEKKTEASVIRALKKLGHEVRILGVYDDPGMILDEIRSHPPDVVFNLTEEFNSRSAYERNVVALLQMLDVRYTGTGPTGLTLCKNKGMAKEILAYHRIQFPDFAIFPVGSAIRRPKRLAFPLFIKPLKNEASYGISQDSFVENDQAFEDRIRFIQESMKQTALAEEYIEGRELYVSIIGNRHPQVLPIREVIFSKVPEDRPRFSTFKAKWNETYRQRWGIQNIFAKDLQDGTADRIAWVCKKVYRALHIWGYGRIDLRLTPEGRILVLEANPNPGLALDDEFAQSALKAGMTYEKLIRQIIRLAIRG